jgi:aspartate racemase
MKVLGIVGGIGPDSTIEYYRSIFREYRSAVPDGSSPQMVIRSVDVRVLLDLIGKGQYAEMASYLSEAIGSLAGAGADFAIIAANTPHIIFDDLHKMSRIPLLSIVEATCKAAELLHMSNLGLIGTRFTMQANFYQRVFEEEGISLVVPDKNEQSRIHEIYVGELLNGQFLSGSRQYVREVVERLISGHGVQGVILAGTELLLLMGDLHEVKGVPFLDTTQIHVKAAVAEILR